MSEAGPSDAAATLRCSNEKCRATRSSCWYGKRPHKYCKRAACVALGKARGHIQTQHAGKRKRDDDAGAANGDERAGTVVRIDRILGCRRAATASPSRARAASSLAMTINKSQGQTLQRVGVHLGTECFAHGQLYVAASRVGHPERIRFALLPDDDGRFVTRNVVYHDALDRDAPRAPPPLEREPTPGGDFDDCGCDSSDDGGCACDVDDLP